MLCCKIMQISLVFFLFLCISFTQTHTQKHSTLFSDTEIQNTKLNKALPIKYQFVWVISVE